MSGDLHVGQGEAPLAVPHHRPKEPTDLPHLRPLRRSSSNLPYLFSSFIGRAQELVEIKQLLVNHRLLTLTGPGGCGKTRLALAVAAELVDHFEDGVVLVEFAAITDAVLVPQAVMTTLGVREQAERAVTETLVDALRPKHLLLLLDNCEHLIDTNRRSNK
jgi:hypothetical protein